MNGLPRHLKASGDRAGIDKFCLLLFHDWSQSQQRRLRKMDRGGMGGNPTSTYSFHPAQAS